MSAQDSINSWGRKRLALAGTPVAADAVVTLEEDVPYGPGCETCGPDPITVTISAGDVQYTLFQSMGDVLQEILASDIEDSIQK